MRSALAAIILFAGLGIAHNATAESKADKAARLVEAQGLLDGLTQQMEAGKSAAAQQGQRVLDQVLSSLHPNEEFRRRFSDAFSAFLEQTSSPWTAEYLVEVYASYYGPHFTERELDQLIEFYASDLGQKDVQSTHSAIAQWSSHFQAQGQEIFEEALQSYIERMKLIAKECACRR